MSTAKPAVASPVRRPTHSRLLERLLFALLWLYPVPFMFRGLDFTDQGCFATDYSNLFRHPASIQTEFTFWLTDVIGAVWLAMTGWMGLLSLHLGYVIVTGTMFTLAYRCLRVAFPDRSISLLAALDIAATYVHFDQQGALNWLSYNELSALFLVWGSFHLLRGVAEDRRRELAYSGAVLALAIFVRLPNVAAAVLVSVIFFHGVVTRTPGRRVARQVLAFGSGWLAGLALALLLMLCLGQLDLVIGCIRSRLTQADPDGTHGSSRLIVGLAGDMLRALRIGAWILTVSAALYFVGRVVAGVRRRALIVVFAVAAGAWLFQNDLPFLTEWAHSLLWGRPGWTYTGVAYWLLAFGVFVPRRGVPAIRRTVALVALLVLLCVPFGSDRLLYNAHHGMALAIGVIGAELYALPVSALFLQVAASTCVVLFGIVGLDRRPFREWQDRSALTAAVAHSKLAGILTTPGRARAVQELVDELPAWVKPGDPVIAFEGAAMAQYLADARPYLYNPDPMHYGGAQFLEALARAEKEEPRQPVIITAKGAMDNHWPYNAAGGVDRHARKFDVMRQGLEEFKKRHGYSRVWEGSFFEIWAVR